jgi:hypothetical protein
VFSFDSELTFCRNISLLGHLFIEVKERTNSRTFCWRSVNKGSFNTGVCGRVFHSFSVWCNSCSALSSEAACGLPGEVPQTTVWETLQTLIWVILLSSLTTAERPYFWRKNNNIQTIRKRAWSLTCDSVWDFFVLNTVESFDGILFLPYIDANSIIFNYSPKNRSVVSL